MKSHEEWGKFFKLLFTPAFSENFDNRHEDEVKQSMNDIKIELSNEFLSYNMPIVNKEHIVTAVTQCSRNKARGPDGIYYEHIVYGGDTEHIQSVTNTFH